MPIQIPSTISKMRLKLMRNRRKPSATRGFRARWGSSSSYSSRRGYYRAQFPRWQFMALLLCLAAVALSTVGGCRARPTADSNSTTAPERTDVLRYPETRHSDQVDQYHGVEVPDPYRWLEDPDSEETQAWITAQNELTFGYLASIPARERIRQRLTELWDFERFGMPRKRGGRYFYTRNDGLQNQNVLYVADGLDAAPRILLDPNTWSEDGTRSLAGWQPSDDGRYLAYGVSDAGSDWREWKVYDVENDSELLDHLRWIRNSGVSWTPDGRGLYYARYREPPEGEGTTSVDQGQQFFFHELGTPQHKDRLVYEQPDEQEWTFSGSVTDDGRYLILYVWKGTLPKNQVFYQDLQQPNTPIIELLSGFDAAYYLVGNNGPTFYFHTDSDAPRWRVIAIDTESPGRSSWSEIVSESDAVLDAVSLLANVFYATYLQNATTRFRRFDLQGRDLGEIPLPGLGTGGGFSGRRDSDETFYSFTNFNTPGEIYRYDLETGVSELFRRPVVDCAPGDFESRQVFVTSGDGTRIPMFIVHKKGVVPDGNCPTLLYGYGGFNVSLTPHFSVGSLVWMEMGGVYAVANLRGGGEYGRQWHEAGTVHNKQNVFDDFTAAAGWLVDQGYTNPQRLAVAGGSNGGLLVGAMTTQHPGKFAAALPSVGVLDMLRYHKFTIGWMWASDYGTSDSPEEFQTLLAYSPLHNIHPGTSYPATLITTGDHDDRVVPAHSFKYAAALQAAQGGESPILIRIETRAGHGAGKPTDKIIAESADKFAFLVKVLGMGDL